MSKVAARFWNSKVHKQLDAKKALKGLGILTGDEAVESPQLVTSTGFQQALRDAVLKPSPLWTALQKRGK